MKTEQKGPSGVTIQSTLHPHPQIHFHNHHNLHVYAEVGRVLKICTQVKVKVLLEICTEVKVKVIV